MKTFRPRRPRAKRSLPYKKRAMKTARVSKSIKSYVNRAIHNNVENKRQIQYGKDQPIRTALTGSQAPDFQFLLPRLTAGTGAYQRVGESVKIRSGVIKGLVNLTAYSATVNPLLSPVYVKMWLLSFKTWNGTASGITSTNINSTFFDYGSSSNGFQANPLDMIAATNRSEYTVYATKMFKLGLGGATTSYPSTSIGVYDNSSWSHPFMFNWGKHVKSALKYEGTTNDIPQSRNLYLVCQAVNSDGTIDANVGPKVEYHFVNTIEYEDA